MENLYKDHLCNDECDLESCPEEPCHCPHGLEILQEKASMRAELARDNAMDRESNHG